MNLRNDADQIIHAAINSALPDSAVERALKEYTFNEGKVILVSIGKAAWTMANSAINQLGSRINDGIVITKYGHSNGNLANLKIYEAGHPIPDANSFNATQEALQLVKGLSHNDTVLFLISGGGSALFEQPLVSEHVLEELTSQLLACGAEITEINTIRKRLSAVKGGKFAKLCEPAHVFSIVLSDIIGDPLDMIASGPAYPDSSTTAQVHDILNRYQLSIPDEALPFLELDPPHELTNVTTVVTGSVRKLCETAKSKCLELGYEPIVLTSSLCCEAREAGSFLASIAQQYQNTDHSMAFIAGGETVVHLTGNGLGGRNQELALAACVGISNLHNTAVFSVGSDGTDGPTDAAGGFVDESAFEQLTHKGLSIANVLRNNNAYHALQAIDGLIITGPTGTNVNDLSVLLIKRS